MKLPWELYPGLTEERLRKVAEIFTAVRHEALDEFDAERGDGAWSFGCKVYERSCARIVRASQTYDWLSVVEPPLKFVFALGGVPIRFFHGLPENPRLGLLQRSPRELDQQQLAFAFVKREDDGWFWRIAVVTDAEGKVAEVVLVQAHDSGETRYPWSIPLEAPVRSASALRALPEPVKLPPAEVGLPEVAKARDHDEQGTV